MRVSEMQTPLHAKCLGFPDIPEAALIDVPGKSTAWEAGMKVKGTADWYWLDRGASWIRRYLEQGGDPNKAIAHHWIGDDRLEPLWDDAYFLKWVTQLREFGITRVAAVDYSTWADAPYATQIFNYYRSCVTTRNYIDMGFKVVPAVLWSSPALYPTAFGWWPSKLKCVVVDGQHMGRNDAVRQRIFWNGAKALVKAIDIKRVLVWAATKRVADEWQETIGPCAWVPSMMYVTSVKLRILDNAKKKIRK